MKWLKISFVVAFAFFLTEQLEAQVSLQLNNGNVVEGASYSINKQDSSIILTTTKGKKKEYQLFHVFSITDSEKKELILYKRDSTSNIFTEAQMKDFIRGEKDASLHFNPKLPYFAGAGVALASSTILGLAGVSTTYSIFVPGTYCAILATREMKESKYKPFASEPDNQYFMEGFKRIAAEKRLRRNLIGAGVGFIVGLIIFR